MHQAFLSGRTHAYTMSWYGRIYIYSDAMKAKFPGAAGAAAGGDDDLDLFGDDDEDAVA